MPLRVGCSYKNGQGERVTISAQDPEHKDLMFDRQGRRYEIETGNRVYLTNNPLGLYMGFVQDPDDSSLNLFTEKMEDWKP